MTVADNAMDEINQQWLVIEHQENIHRDQDHDDEGVSQKRDRAADPFTAHIRHI